LDTAGETPVDLTLTGIDCDVDVARVDTRTLAQVRAVPKALSFNKLRFSHGQKGWRGAGNT
jgi:SHS2 domain-containing protein